METTDKSYIFLGTFRHKLDPKKRFTIPSEWREELAPEKRVAVLSGFTKPCLLMLPMSELKRRTAKRNADRSLVDEDLQESARSVGATSFSAEWDAQGRIRIHDMLLEKAKLSGEIVMVGVLHGIELWSAASWEAEMNKPARPAHSESSRNVGI